MSGAIQIVRDTLSLKNYFKYVTQAVVVEKVSRIILMTLISHVLKIFSHLNVFLKETFTSFSNFIININKLAIIYFL